MVIAVVINSDCITVYKFVQKDEISCPKVLHVELYFIDAKFFRNCDLQTMYQSTQMMEQNYHKVHQKPVTSICITILLLSR